MHIVKYTDSAMSCVKMAEPIEIQFGTLSQVGPGNMYYIRCRFHYWKEPFWGVWPVEKHCKA